MIPIINATGNCRDRDARYINNAITKSAVYTTVRPILAQDGKITVRTSWLQACGCCNNSEKIIFTIIQTSFVFWWFNKAFITACVIAWLCTDTSTSNSFRHRYNTYCWFVLYAPFFYPEWHHAWFCGLVRTVLFPATKLCLCVNKLGGSM